jgi:chromosome segregation ATPase
MKYSNNLKLLTLILLISGCASQSQLQSAQDNAKRLESLIEKERKENDELNSRRSVMESQIQALNLQINKLQNEKAQDASMYTSQIAKLKEDNKKYEDQVKRLDGTISQLKSNNEKTIEALGEKINDLAEDKQELVNEKYAARKHRSKRRRRR